MGKKMKIFHDLDDMEPDVEYELNLKDVEILKNNKLNLEDDTLINEKLYNNQENLFYRDKLKKRDEKLLDENYLLQKRNILDEYDKYDEMKKGFFMENNSKVEIKKKESIKRIKKLLNIGLDKNLIKDKKKFMFDKNSKFNIKKRGNNNKKVDFSFLNTKKKKLTINKNEKQKSEIKKEILKGEDSKKFKINDLLVNKYSKNIIKEEKLQRVLLKGILKNASKNLSKKNKIQKTILIDYDEISEEDNKIEIKKLKNVKNLNYKENGIKSILEIKLPSEQYKEQNLEQENISSKIKSDLEKIPEDFFETNEKIGDVGESLDSAMDFFRKRGLIKKNQKKKKEIKLEYRDKRGRLLNKKEAFKQFSWGYYKKKPSVSKLLKIERKEKNISRSKMNHQFESNKIKKILDVAKNVTDKPYLDITSLNK